MRSSSNKSWWYIGLSATAAASGPLGFMVEPAMAEQRIGIGVDTFIDSSAMNDNYGSDSKIKAVSNAGSSMFPTPSLTHAFFQFPSTFAGTIGSGTVSSAYAYIFPFNNSLNLDHRTIELHPLTHAFVEGTGTQTPLLPTTNGATWNTWDGTNPWTAPGGDYDAANFVVMDNTRVPGNGITPPDGTTAYFAWDITSLINNPTTRNELLTYGAMLKINNENTFIGNDFASMGSFNGTAAKRPLLGVSLTPVTWNVDANGTWNAASNWSINPSTPDYGDNVIIDRSAGAYTVSLSTGNFFCRDLTVAEQLNITGGSLAIGGTLNVEQSGSVTWSGGNVAPQNISVNDTGTLTIAADGTKVLRTQFAIGSGLGRIDITNNKLQLTSTPVGTWTGSCYTGTTALIASGRGNGTWNGGGIVTSQTEATTGSLTGIGVASGAEVLVSRGFTATETMLWSGQTIAGSDTLVMYTYGGDATLDGKINIDDYVRIDSGIAAGSTGWSNGDFNYDGKVNIDDYTTMIDANIGNQNGVFFTTGGMARVSAVPEPAAFGGLFMLSTTLLASRRSRRAAKP